MSAEKKIHRALMRQQGSLQLMKAAQESIEEKKDEERARDASQACNTGNGDKKAGQALKKPFKFIRRKLSFDADSNRPEWTSSHTIQSENNDRPPSRAIRRTMSRSFRSSVKFMKRRLSL